MRIVIKGGVWKNTEDEILKVAVMKYGKNQWARISSLLTRKTPKQCKARWYEWLDPSIKKTEWSKEEDEKLLHLAKLMPTQWRTISPIVGRTSSQCLERYQKLLDAAEREMAMESGASVGTTMEGSTSHHDDVRRLRPGEIDPDPETKPARPDPVDMDEDEKEMLSEARARLANTQGKKAKRKARERQLEESRRLASLQKRRELKAAGIIIGNRKRRSDTMDYNLDIPFQRKPMPGKFDTTDELSKPNGLMFGELMLSQLEGKRKVEREAEERKKDAKRRKMASDTPTFVPSSKNQSIFDETVSIKRAPLHLPAPQVTEEEIQELAKMGATQVPLDSTDMDSDLLSNYTATPRVAMRTPYVPVVDHVKQQARMLAHYKQLSTPLLAEPEPDLPLPPLTSERPSPVPRTTPLLGQTPLHRDRMGINTPLSTSLLTETPLRVHSHLKASLAGLPKPKNDFDIVVPSIPELAAPVAAVPDRSALETMQREQVARARYEKEQLRSSVLTYPAPLPRPATVPDLAQLTASYPKEDVLYDAEQMIFGEMLQRMEHDILETPIPGYAPPAVTSAYTDVTLDALNRAKAVIEEEFISTSPHPVVAWASDSDATTDIPMLTSTDLVQLAEKASAMEKKCNVMLSGYLRRQQGLAVQMQEKWNTYRSKHLEFQMLSELHDQESRMIPVRYEEKNLELQAIKAEEKKLQDMYFEVYRKVYPSVNHDAAQVDRLA